MATILYKNGEAHRVNPYRVQQHLAAGYTTTPGGVEEDPKENVTGDEETEEAETSETESGTDPEPEISCPFPTDSKESLEAWAKENLGIDLDKRKGLPRLIAEVEAAIAEKEG